MKQISFLFVTGESWLDFLVVKVTRSPWSHVVIRFDEDNILLEALAGRGVHLVKGDKYEDWPTRAAIPLQVGDAVYEQLRSQAFQWAGQGIRYGYSTCLAIGVKELFGLRAAKLLLRKRSDRISTTLVCSEMLVLLWRIADPEFFSGREPELVSPDELYKKIILPGL